MTLESKIILPIIILNYNSSNHTIKNINSVLENCDNKYIDYIFIIVDNSTSYINFDKCIMEYIKNFKYINLEFNDKYDLEKIDLQKIKGKKFIYIKMKINYGYSYSNNIGLRLSDILNYKYAIISNPDTRIIDNKSIENMVNIMEGYEDISIVFPKVVDPLGIHQEIMQKLNFYNIVIYNILYPILYLPTKIFRKIKNKLKSNQIYTEIYTSIGCFLLIRLKDIKTVNFLDEDVFLYTEEHILAEKIKTINKKIVCCKNATIYHEHIVSINENPKTDFLRKEAIRFFLKKYLKYSDIKVNICIKSFEFHKKYYGKIIDKLKSKIKFIINYK